MENYQTLGSGVESGSQVREHDVLHLDFAAFEQSVRRWSYKYAFVNAVTMEIDCLSKLLPIFTSVPKQDSVTSLAAIKDALLRKDRVLHQVVGLWITQIKHHPHQNDYQINSPKKNILSCDPFHDKK